jgi:hypothetical protein
MIRNEENKKNPQCVSFFLLTYFYGEAVVAILFLGFVLVPTQHPADRPLQALSSDVKETGREADDFHLEP